MTDTVGILIVVFNALFGALGLYTAIHNMKLAKEIKERTETK